MTLKELGWNSYIQNLAQQPDFLGMEVGRISSQNKTNFVLYTTYGELVGIARGNLLKSGSLAKMPQVGDWVTFTKLQGENKAAIKTVLPRKTTISRKSVGRNMEEQVVATNVDVLFIVQGLDSGPNLRSLERYLVLGQESGAQTVVLLNKSDIGEVNPGIMEEIVKVTKNIPLYKVSAETGEGMEQIKNHISTGTTVAFIGSSGVGKSSLVNTLLGSNVQEVAEVREQDTKGRHTTTRRELIILPSGGLLIDTPGMRELGVWASEEALENTFEDLHQLAQQCQFRDCDHQKSHGCAVLKALKTGEISQGRYKSFLKLHHEIAFQSSKEQKNLKLELKRKEKKQHKGLYKRLKEKYD